ncbi:hypothetical protein Tpen_0756 [Thermofilum pendens Hrk 5]|uniref:MJ1316 RNA cyclic group end recognition domain-containing protein n=2 Tax=Thermofilum pendens TaxID=2269 RepID=A1RY78_THEPD|nr:hypothetical protein Tpen_0756 [Thermofilum pendens Hrk 5]
MRNYLNRLLWDKTLDKSSVVVKFISRSAVSDEGSFLGTQVLRVTRDGVVISVEGFEKFIPFTRITEIEENGRVVFSKKLGVYF